MELKPELHLITYSFDEIEKSIDYSNLRTFLTEGKDNSKLGKYYDFVNQDFLKNPMDETSTPIKKMTVHYVKNCHLSDEQLKKRLNTIERNKKKRQREEEIKILRDAGYDDEYIFNKKYIEKVEETVVEEDGKTGQFGNIYFDYEGYKNRKGKADYTNSVY